MIRKILLGLMIASVASLAWAGIPDAGKSEVWVGEYGDGTGFTDCGAMFLPDGQGIALQSAYRFNPAGGSPVHDCRIWVRILDANEDPIPGINQTEIWLEWGGNITLCDPVPDLPVLFQSNASGENYWADTRFAGGYGAVHKVYVLGVELLARANIAINSPDIDSNGVVNILDTIEYRQTLTTTEMKGDFDFNEIVNILDTIIYRGALTKACP